MTCILCLIKYRVTLEIHFYSQDVPQIFFQSVVMETSQSVVQTCSRSEQQRDQQGESHINTDTERVKKWENFKNDHNHNIFRIVVIACVCNLKVNLK